MWNVPAGLFNWLVPGTGLLPSLHLNFGTEGASGSSIRFKTDHLHLPPWKRHAKQIGKIFLNFNSFIKGFRASTTHLLEREVILKIQDIPRKRNSCSAKSS
jgi:hypothetical protein